MLVGLYCPRCGSAGSIEFDMCQVCLYEFQDTEDAEVFDVGLRGIRESISESLEWDKGGTSDRRALAGV